MNALDSVTQIAYTLMIALNLSMAQDTGRKPLDPAQLFCMASNIYFESRAEGEQGKQAVAHVVQNRIKDPKFPKTACGVIQDGRHFESWKTKGVVDVQPQDRVYIPRRNQCQFSWYCDGLKDIIWVQLKDGTPIEANRTAWRDSVRIAVQVMQGELKDNTGGATYYYAHNLVYPSWADVKQQTQVIGDHTFMKRQVK
jgi:spore germination cell wall hydrolase CwlJ-like protein